MSEFKQGLIMLIVGILFLVLPKLITLGIMKDWFITMGAVFIFFAVTIILSDIIFRSFGNK